MKRLFLIELNELNFEAVERYVERGELPGFARLIRKHGYAITTSEEAQEDIEPWIQWVTAHTGKRLAEHGVRRLGDIACTDHVQIWERLEAKGLRVGAFSPMNAKHRTVSPAFFVPDPWTQTDITAPPLVAHLYAAIAQAVQENSAARISLKSLAVLAMAAVRYASPSLYPLYVRLAAQSVRRPWMRAILLDVLMTDVFSVLCRRSRVNFASLFLNAAAHIQHHYMHSSVVAEVKRGNPDWYCPPGADPVLDVYRAYDRLVTSLEKRFPEVRLLLATGLHQVSHEEPTFYWRLKDHRRMLTRLGIEPSKVTPLMSRDFIADFPDAFAAADAERRMLSLRASDGPIFEIDNRGTSLFVTLAYPHDIPYGLAVRYGNEPFVGLRDEVVFVAIKNGEHDGRGYLLDTLGRAEPAKDTLPLELLHDRIVEAFA